MNTNNDTSNAKFDAIDAGKTLKAFRNAKMNYPLLLLFLIKSEGDFP